MIKNKIVIWAMVSLVTLFSLSGCKEKDNNETTSTPEPTEEYVLETIEEQVLFDEAGVKVTAKSIVDSANYGKGILFILENSTMKALTFDCKRLIINGVMAPDHFGDRVQAGGSVEMVGYFGSGMMDYLGIDNVGEIEVQFDCYDTVNYTSVYTSDVITIKTSEYENMDTEVDFDGEKVFEGSGINIYGKMADDDIFNQAMLFLIENTSEADLLFKSEGVTIDDEFNEYIYGFTMCDTCYKLYYLEFGDEENEEESVGEKFEMAFEIYDRADASFICETGALELNMK